MTDSLPASNVSPQLSLQVFLFQFVCLPHETGCIHGHMIDKRKKPTHAQPGN